MMCKKKNKKQNDAKCVDKNINKENKLSYYSIGKHRVVLVIYALLCLIFSIAFFVILLRCLFALFGIIPILGIGDDGKDLSYLADFLGGLIGIIVGFFADAIFISRWQHLKRYKSLVSLLNKELGSIKYTIKYIWGIDALLNENLLLNEHGNNKILELLTIAGLLNKNGELESSDKIDEFKDLLEYEQTDKKEKYDKLFLALRAVYCDDSKIINLIRNKSSLQGYSGKEILSKVKDYFNTHNVDNYDFEILNQALSLCLALDANKITKISSPTLESVVTSTDGISTFYNLPRYSIWTEEQGNFAKELQDFFFILNSIEENFKVKKSWEFFLICKDLVDRIDKFQKNTDLAYYQENVYDYLYSFIQYLRDKVAKAGTSISDNELLKQLTESTYCQLKIKTLKKKRSNKHTINKSYYRFKIEFVSENKSDLRTKTSTYHQIPPKTVLKFEKVKYEKDNFIYLLDTKKNIYDAQNHIGNTHFNQEDYQKRLPSDFAFSSRYFSDGFRQKLSDETGIELNVNSADRCLNKLIETPKIIDDSVKILSEIFKDITTIIPRKYSNGVNTIAQGKLTILNNEFIGRAIAKIIKRSYDENPNIGETILKVISPIGSYKNRLLQSIYIKLKILKPETPIFYIDISKYENEFNIDDIDNDLDTVVKILEQFKANDNLLTPLFIIDNIREFQCGINDVYKLIIDFLNDKKKINNYKLIIGCDNLYTFNIDQQEKIPFFDKKSITTFNISSMNLSRKEESVDFIINCLKLNGENIDKNQLEHIKRVEQIRDKLLELNFYTLDAYWLIKILKQTNNLKYNNKNILNLYDIGLFKYTAEMGKKQYDELAKSVYSFEYESQHFDTVQLRNNHWKLAREHRSMIDYLVARHYVVLLRETILPKDEYTIVQNLGGKLNLFLPKSVNRFIVCELSKNDIHNLILFCERNIDILDRYPKFECQVSYILRLLGGKYLYLSESKNVLKLISGKTESHINDSNLSDKEINQYLFVSRCIAVAIGYLGDIDEFLKYLKTIVWSNEKPTSHQLIADEINRAFHLDYYGDTFKCLDLNGDFVDYIDDKEKGVNALRKLLIDINNKNKGITKYKELTDGEKTILILQIVTYCSLMKARDYEFKSLISKEDFITPIHQNICKLEQQIRSSEFEDKLLNEKNDYLIDFLLQVLQDVCRKVNSK